MEWINQHLAEIIAVITAVVTFASALTNFIPGDTDDKIVAFLKKIVDFLALNVRK